MNLYSTLLSLFLLAGTLHAQPFSDVRMSSGIDLATSLEDKGSYYNALQAYEDIYKEDPSLDNAFKLGDLNYALRDYKRANSYYSRALRKDKNNSYPELALLVGETFKYQGMYEEAKEAFLDLIDKSTNESLIAQAKLEIKGINAVSKLPELPENISIANAGSKANSKNADFGAVIGPDGKIYFASMQSNKLISDTYEDGYFAKILTSELGKNKSGEVDGTIAEPSVVPNINKSDTHNGGITFSEDGEYMFFTRMTVMGDAVENSQLFMSKRSGDKWAGPDPVASLNDEYGIFHPAIGKMFGNEVLFFSAERPGGRGGKDLYYAEYKGGGSFGTPTPLGDNINTLGDEVTPFYTEGELYFSSDGFPTLGGFDIFKSEWNGSAFLAPQNLGKGYNSPVDDRYFFLPKESEFGFLVSNREGTKSVKSPTCCDDIWTILRPIEVPINLGLALSIYDNDTEKALNYSTVELTELEGVATVDEEVKNTETSNVASFDVDLEKAYKVVISKEGYLSDTMDLKTFGIEKSQIFKGDVFLRKIPEPVKPPEPEYEVVETNQSIRLNNIYYDYDDDKIIQASEPDLQTITDLMNEYPTMVIELSSHTDARGSDKYNKSLAQRRANSARQWILDKGIAADRIKAVGYGEELILNRCTNGVECSDDEHRFNRRTEFKIISGPTSIKIEKKRLRKID